MSNAKLRVALLGAGRIGQEHSRTLIADPRVQVVAVCEPRLENMGALEIGKQISTRRTFLEI
jgi:predicted dehydrogenase